MFKKNSIDYKYSGVLNSLVYDYLSKNQKLDAFYGFFPDHNGFEQALKTSPYKTIDRNELADILMQQSLLVSNGTENSTRQILKLKQDKVYTVTTGHQLCLFTGPLYFIYKIFSTINLAEKLKEKFPAYDFVPVYWMASEDHDFEEVNNFNALEKNISWKSGQNGAVGEFNTAELRQIFPQVEELFGRSENADFLKSLFERAYLQHRTLVDATRYLVNELFGEYGLVVLDGNDIRFKKQFKDELKRDLFEHSPFNLVNESIKDLTAANYHVQVNPRLINCFYLDNGLRTRIEKQGDQFHLVGTERSFSKKEMEQLLENNPERLSPNVVLRPLYQQKILPNLAYVGGPGELAYWLEFKRLFDSANILFPVLMPRNFVTLIDKNTNGKIKKLGFSAKDVYTNSQTLIHSVQEKQNKLFNLDIEKERTKEHYAELSKKVSAIDSTLAGSVAAELQRSINGLERITAKTNRAIRRKLETEINQITAIKQKLFPKNVPQERYENFSSFYLNYGKAFFELLKKKLDPFALEQAIFTEE